MTPLCGLPAQERILVSATATPTAHAAGSRLRRNRSMEFQSADASTSLSARSIISAAASRPPGWRPVTRGSPSRILRSCLGFPYEDPLTGASSASSPTRTTRRPQDPPGQSAREGASYGTRSRTSRCSLEAFELRPGIAASVVGLLPLGPGEGPRSLPSGAIDPAVGALPIGRLGSVAEPCRAGGPTLEAGT